MALSIAVSACASSTSSSVESKANGKPTVVTPPATGKIADLTWGLLSEPATLDPIYSYNFYDDQVLANMCESLLRLNPDLTTSPLLAEKIENPNPTTWVYDIHKGVKFWDGTTLTAADVVWSLQRNLDPQLGSYFADYYRHVEDIKQTGLYQVTVDLKRPTALWNPLLVVGGSAILEKAWGEEQGKKLGTPSSGLMCTGPYELDEWTRGSGIALSRNPNYWGGAEKTLAAKVTFKSLEDSVAQTQAMLSGGVDGMFPLDPSGIPALQSSSGKVDHGKNLMLDYLAPTRSNSPLRNEDVRKALAFVVDRKAIVEDIYHGLAQPMRTYVTPTVWGSNPAVRKIFEPEWNALKMYDTPQVEMAKELFEKAGSPSTPIKLAFPTGGAEQQIVESIQSAAKAIGMNIELKGYTQAGLTNIYYDQKAQKAAGIDLMWAPFNVDVTDPLGLYEVFNPELESIYNYSGYSNPKVTKLLVAASETYDEVKRAKYEASAERIVMDELPMIPLVSPDVVVYQNDKITGAPSTYSVYWSAWADRVGSATAE